MDDAYQIIISVKLPFDSSKTYFRSSKGIVYYAGCNITKENHRSPNSQTYKHNRNVLLLLLLRSIWNASGQKLVFFNAEFVQQHKLIWFFFLFGLSMRLCMYLKYMKREKKTSSWLHTSLLLISENRQSNEWNWALLLAF